MFKIGLSTAGKETDASFFENCKKSGISCLEISKSREFNELPDYKILRKMADDYNIELWSFHLPFKPFDLIDISTSDAAWRKKSIEYISEIIKKAADIGIDKYILHSGGLVKVTKSESGVTRNNPSEASERLNYACESYAEFAEIAHRAGGVICVENLPPVCVGTNIEEIKKIVSTDNRLKVCYDSNHFLPGDGPEFIKALADRIITCHISDYDLTDERHWFPGEGKIEWQSVYKALCDIGYKGPWLYEIRFEGVKTIERERPLTCDDVVRNANEIFANKKLTVIPHKKLV